MGNKRRGNSCRKLNHPSTIICPITTDVINEVDILRVYLIKGESNLKENCDILIDQMRAVDNKRLIKKVGNLKNDKIQKVIDNIKKSYWIYNEEEKINEYKQLLLV